jgi:hypothetical protein
VAAASRAALKRGLGRLDADLGGGERRAGLGGSSRSGQGVGVAAGGLGPEAFLAGPVPNVLDRLHDGIPVRTIGADARRQVGVERDRGGEIALFQGVQKQLTAPGGRQAPQGAVDLGVVGVLRLGAQRQQRGHEGRAGIGAFVHGPQRQGAANGSLT